MITRWPLASADTRLPLSLTFPMLEPAVMTGSILPVPLDALVIPAAPDGRDGAYRATGRHAQIAATHDLDALRAWLARFADMKTTFENYRKEAERLLLWSIVELAKPAARRLRFLLDFGYATGLRASELVGATLGQVETDARGEHWLRVTGKGKKIARVALPPLAWEALARYLAERSLPVAQKLRLASPHWMRHTHATHALGRGAELTTLRDNLRHASVSTTSIYLHSDEVKQTRQIGDAFGSRK